MVSHRALLVVTLVIAAACRPQAPPAPLSSADQRALRAITDSFVQRVRRADWPGAAAVYAVDARLMPPDQPALVGRDAILAWMKAFPPIRSFDVIPEDVGGQGDVAYMRGRYVMTFTPPGAKAAVVDTGKFLEVHLRQPDGSWPLVADIFNSDKPAMH